MVSGLVYGCVVPHPPILVPELGGLRAEQVQRTSSSVRTVAADIRKLAPDAVVLVSPHAPIDPRAIGIHDYGSYHGDLTAFGDFSVSLAAPGAPGLAEAIARECRTLHLPVKTAAFPSGTLRLDHGATVPLYFLREAGVDCPLLLISFCAEGPQIHRDFGVAVRMAAEAAGIRVVLVCSGDMSHRLLPGAPAGFSPRGQEFDDLVVSALHRGDFQEILTLDEDLLDEAGECGYRSLVIALGAFPESMVEVLSYEGPFGVGYLVARFLPGEAAGEPGDEAVEREALRLARLAVESYVTKGAVLMAPANPAGFLACQAGVFVSLKIRGELRGCIGTYRPSEASVAGEIVRNAICSSTRDPRFPPVSSKELPWLEYSIDVLSELEPVDGPAGLDPARYGVLVESGARRGLLLPDLEGVDSAETQIEIARKKAGISRGEPLKMSRFTVRRIREKSLR